MTARLKSAYSLGCTAILLSIALSGCGNSSPAGPKTTTVTGAITFDGEPIKEGSIVFRRVDGNLKSFGGQISGGNYSLQAEPGQMAVEVFASREVPGKFSTENGLKEPVIESYIPAKFNSKTELTAEVTDSGKQSIPFELKSK